MYISKFRLYNYKSFLDSGEIEFSEGINLIVGQNNSGKTTLLEALNLRISDIRHKSLLTLPQKNYQSNLFSNFEAELLATKLEIKSFLLKVQSNYRLGICQIHEHAFDLGGFKLELEDAKNTVKYFNEWLGNNEKIKLELNKNGLKERKYDFFASKSDFGLYDLYIEDGFEDLGDRNLFCIALNYNSDTEQYDTDVIIDIYENADITEAIEVDFEKFIQDPENCIDSKFYNNFLHKIYRFFAERKHIGKSVINLPEDFDLESNLKLKPDASNLPEALYALSMENFSKFLKYSDYVREILPFIEMISVARRPSICQETETQKIPNNDEIIILVWSHLAFQEQREDLAIPLSDCGTGVSQVLAIVYVVFMSEERKTIIIDEPSSFLHPGAARKLIEFLKEFPQNQYFISTHSPTIINAALPCNIVQVKHENGESKAFSIDPAVKNDLFNILDEIGVRISDIFGFDNILWVEGETEEKCFPMILQRIKGKSLKDTAIMKGFETGYLDRKKKDRLVEEIIKVYQKVGALESIVPPMQAFILDRDSRTESQRKEIEERYQGKIKFIKKNMYEDYLIDCEAIAEVINQEIREINQNLESDEKIMIETSSTKIQNLIDNDDDCQKVKDHSSKLLTKIFEKQGIPGFSYQKTKHSVSITKWLIDHKKDNLTELADELEAILENKQ